MRTLGWTLALSFVALDAAYAQQPAGAPGNQAAPGQNAATQTQAPANSKRLDELLTRWEQAMASVQSITAQIKRTSVDKTFQTADEFEGTAKYMKPNLAMLEMKKKGKEQTTEKYVCTGNFLYEYSFTDKVIRAHELPPPKPGQVADDGFLSFLFGMRAEEAKRRYDMKLVKGPPEDQWYYYIEILPRYPQDKADFSKARLVLLASTFLPRELWFEQPNGNEVKWDIPKIDQGVNLNRTEFMSPTTPQGWKLERMPKPAAGNQPPRVVRPNQP
jgi:TIGR03009 family protein